MHVKIDSYNFYTTKSNILNMNFKAKYQHQKTAESSFVYQSQPNIVMPTTVNRVGESKLKLKYQHEYDTFK